MKLDYRMNYRGFVMTMTKKAQKRGIGLTQKATKQDTVMTEPGFEARPGFQDSSITYWIYVLGRVNKKST